MPCFRLLAFCLICCASAACAQKASNSPQQFADLGDLKLESGAVIHDCKLGCRTFGNLKLDKSNVAKLLILEGDCGHVAPGCEASTVRPAIATALQ
jgi:homoserine acetyltransferase